MLLCELVDECGQVWLGLEGDGMPPVADSDEQCPTIAMFDSRVPEQLFITVCAKPRDGRISRHKRSACC